MTARAIMVAAPRSGSGKTTLTLGLLAAWRRRGLAVGAAKSGPDYIDPAFHAAASGGPGVNLDSWAMHPSLLQALLAEAVRGPNVVVVESAMGLFDGVDAPPRRSGAAADLAAQFAIPVLLVLDVSGQAQSAAATVRGFASHAAEVAIAGVVLNRVASPRHRDMASGAIERLGIPVLGSLPRAAAIALPERHLGLVQAQELPALQSLLEALADVVEAHCDLDAILAVARAPRLSEAPGAGVLPPPGQRIALACDAAFSFVYPHLLAGWRRAGAELAMFSPLADQPPPDHCDVCWLPGGYPELHAATLAGATRFRHGLVRFAQSRPVHGECGGFMALGRRLQDADGTWHEMAGLLGHATSFAERRMNLGYREARLLADAPIGPAGGVVRGHEFHYATLSEQDAGCDRLVALIDGQGRSLGLAGERRGHVTGTFFHAIRPRHRPRHRPSHRRSRRMIRLDTMDDVRAACATMPATDAAAAEAAARRQQVLTKPPGSLGQLEELAVWLAGWQQREVPTLDHVQILVFAGNHGVAARGVSPYPASVTAQMVANFAAGGAAINQLARLGAAHLRVVPLDLDRPTLDFTVAPAMDEAEFLAAVRIGRDSVPRNCDLLCLGEMGIGNTTVAAALAAAVFGGDGAAWAGRGTGLDDAGLARKIAVIDAALARHAPCDDPLRAAAALGGRELAAILGAALTARHRRIPILLDGFVCCAAVAPLAALAPDGLAHAKAAHVSAEAGHRRLLEALHLAPLLDLRMRLGEASGAALGVMLVRAAVGCHAGMATFAEAGVADRASD